MNFLHIYAYWVRLSDTAAGMGAVWESLRQGIITREKSSRDQRPCLRFCPPCQNDFPKCPSKCNSPLFKVAQWPLLFYYRTNSKQPSMAQKAPDGVTSATSQILTFYFLPQSSILQSKGTPFKSPSMPWFHWCRYEPCPVRSFSLPRIIPDSCFKIQLSQVW